MEGIKKLGETLAPVAANAHRFKQAIDALHNYSLIKRDSRTGTLTVHRLVQEVLRNSLSTENQQKWKLRAVRVVNATLPSLEHSAWTECETWLPHIAICSTWVKEEEVPFSITASVLNWAGCYLRERARYNEARPFLKHALTISEFARRAASLAETTNLNDLAYLYWSQGEYGEAEELFKRAQTLQEGQTAYEALTPQEKHQYAESLQSLACVYQTLGKYKESEELFLRALDAVNLQSLACVYQILGRLKESEELFLRASTSDGPTNELAGAITMSNLAELYRRLGRYAEANLLLKHAQSIHETYLEPEHLKTAYILHKQALLFYDQGQYDDAEKLFVRTRTIYETCLGYEHPSTAQVLHGLAEICRVQHQYEEAETLFEHALEILKRKFDPEHPTIASAMNGLALLYLEQGQYVYVKQERCMKRGRYEEAKNLFTHAWKIRERCLGKEHPDTALSLYNLAVLCYAQEDYGEAEEHFRSGCHVIREDFCAARMRQVERRVKDSWRPSGR
jgi:tetratricopeptide (TPR) repeat protein